MKDFSSTVSYSPSFSFYASSEFAAAAVKVSRENQSQSSNDEDADFEFETSPLHEDTFVHFPTFTPVPKDTVFMSKKKDADLAAGAASIRRWSSPPSPFYSESEEIEKFSGNCLWSPLRSPAAGAGHSKITKRCRLKNFLSRSHSDGGDASKTSSPVAKGKDKTAASYNPTNIGEGDKRRKSYLPYRQDLIGVFAGMRRLRH